MPVIDEMIHFCSQGIICKFSFWALKSTFSEYMKGQWQLFYTFNEIMQQTFCETKCGTTIFNNIEILRIENFWWDDISWNADPFISMCLSCLLSTSDAGFGIVTDKRLLSIILCLESGPSCCWIVFCLKININLVLYVLL